MNHQPSLLLDPPNPPELPEDSTPRHACGSAQPAIPFGSRLNNPASDVCGSATRATVSHILDPIPRAYFAAAIITGLTFGAAWGVWILWRIGEANTFTGVSVHEINAHGHAQIFGWVGLFLMGFTCHTLHPAESRRAITQRIAHAVLLAMAAGLTIRTVAMAMHSRPGALSAAMIGGTLEIAAIALFVAQILQAEVRRGAAGDPSQRMMFWGLWFFALQAIVSLWHTYTTMTAGTREQLLWYVGTYQAVLRDLQIHGMGLMMLLGLAMRLLPPDEAWPTIGHGRSRAATVCLATAVIGESLIFILYRWTHLHAVAAALMLPWLLLAVGAMLIPWAWKPWKPTPRRHPADRFVQAACAWLAGSMVMLLLLPVYQWISGLAFSHAYYGSIRHAITVGFISMMILGLAERVVPAGTRPDLRTQRMWRGSFLLVNLGCLLRVTMQTLTDWHPLFFTLVGFSGLLELAGLTWWGVSLIVRLRRRDDEIIHHRGAEQG